MAKAVNGTRVPISQTIPDPTRRALLTAIPASAIGVAAISPSVRALAASDEASDEQFLAWERESDRLLAITEREGIQDEELTAASMAALEIEELIFETRSTSLVAAQVKLRTLLAWEQDDIDRFAAPLEHVLEALGGWS